MKDPAKSLRALNYLMMLCEHMGMYIRDKRLLPVDTAKEKYPLLTMTEDMEYVRDCETIDEAVTYLMYRQYGFLCPPCMPAYPNPRATVAKLYHLLRGEPIDGNV